MSPKAGAQPNQSLIDGIVTLQALATSDEPIGCRELARRLGMETTRVNRLLKTLNYLGLANQTESRKYTAGAGMHVLAAQSLYASGLLRNAVGPMEKLKRFGRVVALGVLWRDSVSFLYHAQAGMSSGEAIGRVGLYPATQSGVGMVLLSETPDEYVREVYDQRAILGFPDGVESLLDALKKIKEVGYAMVEISPSSPLYPDESHHTIAVPIGNPVTSALGMSGWIPESSVADSLAALLAVKHEIELAESGADAEPPNIATLSERFIKHPVLPSVLNTKK